MEGQRVIGTRVLCRRVRVTYVPRVEARKTIFQGDRQLDYGRLLVSTARSLAVRIHGALYLSRLDNHLSKEVTSPLCSIHC